jgi:hypothetical protein
MAKIHYKCSPMYGVSVLHIKITHFDSVTSVVITKVTSVAFFSQGRKCRIFLTRSQVSHVAHKCHKCQEKHTAMMPMSFL